MVIARMIPHCAFYIFWIMELRWKLDFVKILAFILFARDPSIVFEHTLCIQMFESFFKVSEPFWNEYFSWHLLESKLKQSLCLRELKEILKYSNCESFWIEYRTFSVVRWNHK